MSKLRERIRDIARRRPAPLGFAAMRASEPPHSRQILVVAEVEDADGARQAAEAGADAVIYAGGSLDHLREVVEAANKAVVGARVDAAAPQHAAAIHESGADFLVCSDEATDAAALMDQQIGYIIVAPNPLTPALSGDDAGDALRLLRPLDLDGLLIGSLPETMTVRQQLRARRLGELARKPLFVHTANEVTPATLQLWRDAGAVAVVAAPALIQALARSADAVPPPRRPQGDRSEAIVPAPPAGGLEEEDEEDI